MAIQQLGRTVVLSHDPAEAMRFYNEKLGFQTIHNDGTYFHAGVPGQQNVGIWFLKAGDEDREIVGKQAGSHPFMVMYTADCRTTTQEMKSRGVRFRREPKEQQGSVFAHLEDLYGNEIVLVQLLEQQRAVATEGKL